MNQQATAESSAPTPAPVTDLQKPATLEEAVEDLSMAICKLTYAVTLMPGTKEHKDALAKAMALAEPYTPQLEDNHDDETA